MNFYIKLFKLYFSRPPQWGIGSRQQKSGCARLSGEVGPPLGGVVEEVAVLVVLVRRHRHAVRAAVRRAVDDFLYRRYSFYHAPPLNGGDWI